MTTLNKIAYSIAHSQGRAEDLAYIERLKFAIHAYRAQIIRRDLDRNRFTPSQYLQTIGGLEMEFVDASSCPQILVGCNVFRSKKRVPDPIRFKDRVPFYFVGTLDGKKGYSPMNASALDFVGSSKYTAKLPRYYYDDGYIYLINAAPKKIRVKGVFEYPHLLAEFNTDDSICFDDDSRYPISNDLARSIVDAILNLDIRAEDPQKDDNETKLDG